MDGLLYFLLCLQAFFASASVPNDLVINEILFNPSRDGYDYVEVFNKGNDSIDLEEILIGNRNVTNDISGLKLLAGSRLLLQPKGFAVITGNEKWLRQNYVVSLKAIVCQIPGLPSFPDDEGTVVMMNKTDSTIIDELKYNEKWHFALISDPSGVSLERINYQHPTQDKNNWSSASSSSGNGTPGYQNSQFRADLQAQGEVSIVPKIFTPDNDGSDDAAFICLKMKEPGYVANIHVYDLSGRVVRYLLKNEFLGLQAEIKWDGCDDRSMKLPKGAYIAVTEVFNLNGQTKKFKNVVILNYVNR